MYCCTPKALYNHVGGGGVSPGWCNDCHRTMAPVRSPHTSYRWRGERDRANQVNDWQGPVEGTWPGHRGYTPTLYEKCHGIFNDHRESGPWFNVSSERRCLLTVQCPGHNTGALGPTQNAGWAPPAGLTNTSSSSNLLLPGGLPSRYWPAQPCLASVGNRSWAAGWYGPSELNCHLNFCQRK